MWKNRNVWLVLGGEFIAGVGLWLGIIGNLEFLQTYVPSDFLKSLILFSGLLAGVMVGPLAGRVIDTYQKKQVLLYAGAGRMFSVVFMLLALKYESIFWMVCFMVSIQIAAAFYFPALQATIPLVVAEKELLAMNGIHMNVATMARIFGTAFGGALLVVMSLYSLYIGAMIAYALLFLSTFFLTVKENKTPPSSKQETKQGFKEVIPILRNVPIVYIAILLTFVPQLFIGGFNLMVINISELQHDPSIKGWLYTIEGTCFLIGAFIVKRITDDKRFVRWMYVFAIMIAFAHLSLYFADIKIASILSFGLFGMAVGCFFPITATIFQTNIAKEYHGRFFSFKNMLDRVMFQVVLLSSGFLLDTIGLQKMVLIFGALSLFIIFYVSLKKGTIKNRYEQNSA
ncbi:MFS transporter [Thermolongibacillus altinsuensis]|uniref:MFS transporter n=1 Tax=Thermolongibacillus altinsuensis TaxID=575256 RepID=UPI00242A323C|nr:MFS transporter [Thermolongibacillus altinsuensis]GMB08042.1 MFS transporter [Thermolongibacillus altinsuensis]